MLTLLFDSGFWYDLILIVFIGFVIFLCFKYPNSRVYVFSFLGIIFVGITAYCGIQLNNYYTIEGGVWGYITGLIENNTVTTVTTTDTAQFSLENIVLTQNSDGTYSATIYSNDITRLEQGKVYGAFVNDEPCSQVDSSSNYVRAEYHYVFLDNNLDVLCEDTLQFNFAFYGNSSEFTLTTYSGQEAVNYWNTYFSRNNLVVEVKPIGYEKDDELSINGQIDDYVTLSYYVDDEVRYSFVYTKGSQIDKFPSVEKENLIFSCWQDVNGNKIESLKIEADTNLYAHFYESAEEFLVDYTAILEVTEGYGTYSSVTNDIDTIREHEDDFKILVDYSDGSFQLYDSEDVTYNYSSAEQTGWYYTTNYKELSELTTTTITTFTISLNATDNSSFSLQTIELTTATGLSQVNFVIKKSESQIIGPSSGFAVNYYNFDYNYVFSQDFTIVADSVYFIY